MLSVTVVNIFIDSDDPDYPNKPVKILGFEDPDAENLKLEMKLINKVRGSVYYYTPYVNLINHWKMKGYKPVKIEE
jgi:hypothetical protein